MRESPPVRPGLTLEVEYDHCWPACGLGGAFAVPRHFEVCARCDWIDDPAAFADQERYSELNHASLDAARRWWAERAALRVAAAPLSSFAVVPRIDGVGCFDYNVDGISMRDRYPSAAALKASIGPWNGMHETTDALTSGVPDTPTGRTRLYVCPCCGGDDDVGAVTADVRVFADRVTWSRIGVETCDAVTERRVLDARRGPAGFAFNATEYRAALRAARLPTHTLSVVRPSAEWRARWRRILFR